MSNRELDLRNLKFFNANVEGYWDEEDYMDDIVDYTILLNQSYIEDHTIVLADDIDIEDHTLIFL